MYRAVACKVIEKQVPMSDPDAIASIARTLDIRFDAQGHVFADGDDVTEAVRSSQATRLSSPVSTIAGVRKRLLEGGHHHHSSKGEAQGEYEEGFVVVTRAAKIAFLDASKAIGALSLSPNEAGLDTEWKKVQATYSQLMQK